MTKLRTLASLAAILLSATTAMAQTTAPTRPSTTTMPAATTPPAPATATPATATPAMKMAPPMATTSTDKMVNLNTATAAELDALPGIGKARTKVIMTARGKAPFKDWADFDKRTAGTSVNAGVKAKIKPMATF